MAKTWPLLLPSMGRGISGNSLCPASVTNQDQTEMRTPGPQGRWAGAVCAVLMRLLGISFSLNMAVQGGGDHGVTLGEFLLSISHSGEG